MEIFLFIFKCSAKQSHGIILSDLTLGIIGKISKHYKTKLLQRYFDERAPHRAVQLTSLFNVLVYIYQEQKHTIHKSQLSFTYRHAQQRMPNSNCHSQNINMITPKKHKYDYALLSTLWIRDSCSPVGENEYVYSDFQDDNGGVSESSQVLVFWGYRSPWTSPAVAYDSSSAISSGVSFTDSAPTFWLKFSIFVVPGMGHTSVPCWWTQASASCDGVHPFLADRKSVV